MNEVNEVVPTTCAACKHLRRRCDETCVVAGYFPPERTEEFLMVHRVFGIHNVIKMMASVDQSERDKTVETLILEAKIWHENPAQGCLGVERKLRAELDKLTRELHQVNQQLQLFKAQSPAKVRF